jgi:uncharacterized membrane protein
MKQFQIWIAIVLLISSLSVLANILFRPQPIQIILETGQEVSAKTADYFTITTVMIIIFCSFVIGASAIYLFYNSENGKIFPKIGQPKEEHKEHSGAYDIIIPLLRDDEKKVVHIIKDQNGEILQNELVLKSGLSKVKTTRIIASLERKQIVSKQRHGMTNHIRLLHPK